MPFQKGQKPHNFKDLTGEKYNMLTVISLAKIENNKSYWLCKCECGNEKIISIADLKKTKSCGCAKKKYYKDLSGFENEDIVVVSFCERRKGKIYWNCKCKHCGKIIQRCGDNIKKGQASCKCMHMKRIGKSNSKTGRNTNIYSKWIGMKNRCFNKSEKSYKNYGARGISICDEWLVFENFYKWSLTNGYQEGYSIERIDVNGNYCPENCCWIPIVNQAKNKRNTIYAELDGKTKRLVEWCEILGLNKKTVYNRIYQCGLTPEEALIFKRK